MNAAGDGRGGCLHLGHVFSPLEDGSLLSIDDGALLLDGEGRIADVGARAEILARHTGVPRHDHGGALLMPGFVDAHVHLPQVLARARVRGSLLQWLEEAIYPAEAAFADPTLGEAVAGTFVEECLRSGVTTAAVFLTSHEAACERAFAVMADAGLRILAGLCHMDRDAPADLLQRPADSLAAAARLAAAWHGHDAGRITYAFCPRFALSCSENLLRGIAAAWRDVPGAFVHTHLAENPEECAQVLRRFPGARDYLDVYESFGLLGERTLLAHAIHLRARETAAIAAAGAGVAHCPAANFFLKSGVFPWRDHESAGVRFGLGSDVGAGPEIDPFRVMRAAFEIQPALFLDPGRLLWHATVGGARALRQDAVTGSLEAGKDGDFLVVDPTARPEIANLLPLPPADLAAALVFLGDGRIVSQVHVRGRLLRG